MSKEVIDNKIESAVAKWDQERTVAQYIRDELSEIKDGKSKIKHIVDNLINKSTGFASTEENEIKFNELLLKAATLDQKPQNQTNLQVNFGHDEFIMKNK